MLNKTILLSAVATIALTVTGLTVAGSLFNAIDSDQNGTLTKDEALKMPLLIKQWKALDVDANEEITVEEFKKFKAN